MIKWILFALAIFGIYIYVSYLVIDVVLTMIYPEATKIQIIAVTFLFLCITGALSGNSRRD